MLKPDEQAMSEPKRAWTGTWIPRDIWVHRELTWMERCLWAEISNLEGKDGCFASNDYLAKLMGTTPSTVANILSKLRKLDLIRTVGFDGRRRFIRTLSQGSLPDEGRHHPQVNIENRVENRLETPCSPSERDVSGGEGKQTSDPSKAKPKATELDPLHRRLILIFQKSIRSPNRDSAEMRAWKKRRADITEEDVAMVEKFYRLPKSQECDKTWHRKTAVTQLLNQWTAQVEAAWEYCAPKAPLTQQTPEDVEPEGWYEKFQQHVAEEYRDPEMREKALAMARGGWKNLRSYFKAELRAKGLIPRAPKTP